MNGPEKSIVPSPSRDEQGCIALDQWRGLALVLVLISHGFHFTDRVSGIGRVGVNLFFFISGILVFRTLTRSRATNDWDRARSFWWRRFRRLYPALVVYVVLILPVVWWLQNLPDLPSDSSFHAYLTHMWMAVLYLIDYCPQPGPPMPLGHLWSLGCEMQFYLLAPVIFIAGGLSNRRRMITWGIPLVLLVGLGAIEPVLPKLAERFGWTFNVWWRYHFEFAVWPMMVGFFCEYRREWFSRLSAKVVSAAFWSSLATCAVCFGLMLIGEQMKPFVILAGTLLLLPCLLAYLYGRPVSGTPGSTLRWLGERTYSIYLWQQPLTICKFLPSLWQPAGALMSVFIGAASFRFFEFPFLSVNRQKQEKIR